MLFVIFALLMMTVSITMIAFVLVVSASSLCVLKRTLVPVVPLFASMVVPPLLVVRLVSVIYTALLGWVLCVLLLALCKVSVLVSLVATPVVRVLHVVILIPAVYKHVLVVSLTTIANLSLLLPFVLLKNVFCMVVL